MAFNVSQADAVLKVIYPEKKMLKMLDEIDPLLGLIDVKTKFGGKEKRIPVQYGRNQSHGSTFATARAVGHNLLTEDWILSRKKYYGFAIIDREFIEASKDSEEAFVDGLTDSVDDILDSVRLEMARQVWGSSTAAIGTIGSVAGGVITLTTLYDSVNFFPGMNLDTYSSAGVIRAGGPAVVTAVNRAAGTVTYTGTITGIAATDLLYRAGTKDLVMNGMDDWVPSTAPGSTAFNGIDRTLDLDAFSGIRITPTATTNIGAIQEAVGAAQWRGAKNVTHGFVHPLRWQELSLEMGDKVVRDDSTKSLRAGIGYESLGVATPQGFIKILFSNHVKSGDLWLLNPKSIELHTLGVGPAPIKNPMSGTYVRDMENEDSFEVRVGYMGNLCVRGPKNVVRVNMSSVGSL